MEITFAVIVGVVGALTEVIKRFGITKRYIPIIAIILGIVVIGGWQGFNFDNVFIGVVVGLTSSGVYSGGKTFLKGNK